MEIRPTGERLKDFWEALMPAIIRLAEEENKEKEKENQKEKR